MNTQKTHEFKVVVFEDKAGLRFVHCDQAYAAISGPGETDTVIAEFSNMAPPAAAINAELLAALKPFANYACNPRCGCHNCIASAAIAHATGAQS